VTRSYYDGQMPVEEDVTTGGSTTLTRNFVGARGLEAISTTQNSVTNTTYPLYDTHGNMVATLSKNTAGTSWSVGDERSYDVWGGVRSGAATGGPKGRYVANLGQVQDDESGLIYMRARYYEPETGRFVNQDPGRDGKNWFIYSDNNPVNRIDAEGTEAFWTGLISIVIDLLKTMGFRRLASMVWDMAAEALSRKLRVAAFNMIGRGMEHQAESAALAGRQDYLGKAAAGALGRLAAKELAAGLTLLSIANFLHYLDDGLGPYLLM
jgi:RHS repeat-associated protein